MKIQEERKKSGLSTTEAGKLLKVSKRTIEAWETGARVPKIPESEIVELYHIAGIFTGEGREALLSGEVSLDDARNMYKIQTAKRLSKWGRYPSTFDAIWDAVPESAFAALTGEQLAELVDALKAVYDKGRLDGKVDQE